MLSNTVLALALIPGSLAHFTLDWPTSRGRSEDTAEQFPCGGYSNVQQQRTDWPISGGPLQLNMGHPQTNVAVYMAVGDNPGSGFSVKLRPQFVVEVLGNFCVGQLNVPSGLNVSDGTPASIQVVSNAHSGGGLYQVSGFHDVQHTAISNGHSALMSRYEPQHYLNQTMIATARTTQGSRSARKTCLAIPTVHQVMGVAVLAQAHLAVPLHRRLPRRLEMQQERRLLHGSLGLLV